MAARTTLDPNSAGLNAYNGGFIPTGAPPAYSIPSTEALPSSGPLPAQPSLVEQAITKALKNRCIFFGTGRDKQFEFLDDHYPCSFEFGGRLYLCSLAALLAQKFSKKSKELQGKFVGANAGQAFHWFADLREERIQKHVAFSTRLDIHRAKFNQDPKLAQLLLLTADAYLFERDILSQPLMSTNEDISAQNLLGWILMQIRKELGGIGVVEPPTKFHALLKEFDESFS